MAKTTKKKPRGKAPGGPERYPWKTLQPLHHLFFPGKKVRTFRVTALAAGARYGFKVSVRQCAMDGQEGVMVWRHADPKSGLFD